MICEKTSKKEQRQNRRGKLNENLEHESMFLAIQNTALLGFCVDTKIDFFVQDPWPFSIIDQLYET